MTIKNHFLNFFIIVRFYYKSGNQHFLDEALQASSNAFMLLAAMVIFQFSGTLTNQIITYILLGNLLYTLTNPRIDWLLGNIIKDKKLLNYLLPPTSIFTHFIAFGMANSWFGFLISCISIIPISLFFAGNITLSGTSLINLILFILIAIFGFLFRMAWQLLIAFSTFLTKDVGGSVAVSINLELFLAGTLFPLSVLSTVLNNLLPNNFTFLVDLLYLQPLAFVVYHPMQIILGNYNLELSLLILLGILFWTVFFWLITILTLKIAKLKDFVI
jgi:ABC-type uncharacterized transport system permease subunit